MRLIWDFVFWELTSVLFLEFETFSFGFETVSFVALADLNLEVLLLQHPEY